MKKIFNKKTIILCILTACLIATPVYAKTIVKFNICEFRETLQLLKLLGIVLNLVKIIIPLILIFMCIKDVTKAIISGKGEDLTGSIPMFAKRFVAAALIFFVPTLVTYAIDEFVSFDDKAFKECTTCLFEPDDCVIPKKNPELRTDK